MKIAAGCLCLLALAIICETHTIPEEEFKKLQIEEPQGCKIERSYSYDSNYDMTCPGFIMKMEMYNISSELNNASLSTVECSNDSPPYQYLRTANSMRNALLLIECPPPEHGSFGEACGWPNMEMFKFDYYGNFEPLARRHFSGMNNLWYLVLAHNSTHPMDDDLLSDLPNLRQIHISLKHVNKNIFRNLTKLERLGISLKSPEGFDNFDTSEMKHLPALKTFELTFSRIARLSKRLFEGCPHIETLVIKFNKIDAIDANAFEPMTNLKHVNLKMNELSWLPAGLFSKNKKLETFAASSLLFEDTITSLPSGFFSYLPNLREITIECKLSSIPADLIRGSTNLELLNLRHNQLFWMPRDLLENHTKLKRIDLYNNRFSDKTSTNIFDNKSPLTEIHFDKVTEQ